LGWGHIASQTSNANYFYILVMGKGERAQLIAKLIGGEKVQNECRENSDHQ
jgi:hypothetical protein